VFQHHVQGSAHFLREIGTQRYPAVIRNTNVLLVIAILATLALPASALAGHHDQDDDHQPYAWHSQGWHRGWVKHHQGYAVRPVEDEDEDGAHCHLPPPERPPAFLCDGDGDDCEPSPGVWDDEDYGPPISFYRSAPPARYNLVQQRERLLEHRRRAYQMLNLMHVRHDGRAAQRLSTVINRLDAGIARDDRLLAGARYPSPPVPYYPLEPNPNYGSDGYNPGYGYNPAYGNSYAPPSPGVNPLVSMVAPLLGFPPH
jgi:hypothetical protein